jgi:hypothetical protein
MGVGMSDSPVGGAWKPRHGYLVALLAALWEAETSAALYRVALAERLSCPRLRARVMVLAAFSRAHASRIMARLTALGRGPLPVEPEGPAVGSDVGRALLAASAASTLRAERAARAHDHAVKAGDLSSSWVLALNRTEDIDAAKELAAMAQELGAKKGTT